MKKPASQQQVQLVQCDVRSRYPYLLEAAVLSPRAPFGVFAAAPGNKSDIFYLSRAGFRKWRRCADLLVSIDRWRKK